MLNTMKRYKTFKTYDVNDINREEVLKNVTKEVQHLAISHHRRGYIVEKTDNKITIKYRHKYEPLN